MERARLDQYLVDHGLAPSRSRARAIIEAGLVRVSGTVETKPARQVQDDAAIILDGIDHPWVSRGGVKLAAALEQFAIDPSDAVALDVGASTGGFTQVLLACGARLVYAVEVGSGQLAPVLGGDSRIVLLENQNARSLSAREIPEPVSVIVCDASFIGLETILPAPLTLAAPGAVLIALIKPQFEVGPGRVGKGGIVRDAALQDEVCQRLSRWIDQQPGWRFVGLTDSPIPGSDGNKEFLLCARRDR
jgi:23S rRNA (cytidine1920-2'-O)/16S rRNA (cytidine1409-2'-O)-methyltransferase